MALNAQSLCILMLAAHGSAYVQSQTNGQETQSYSGSAAHQQPQSYSSYNGNSADQHAQSYSSNNGNSEATHNEAAAAKQAANQAASAAETNTYAAQTVHQQAGSSSGPSSSKFSSSKQANHQSSHQREQMPHIVAAMPQVEVESFSASEDKNGNVLLRDVDCMNGRCHEMDRVLHPASPLYEPYGAHQAGFLQQADRAQMTHQAENTQNENTQNENAQNTELVQAPSKVSGVPAVALLGFVVGSAVTFAVHRFRCGILAECQEPLLIA